MLSNLKLLCGLMDFISIRRTANIWFRPKSNINRPRQTLYMSSGEAAFYRTGFKNGVTWAEAILAMTLKTLEYGDMVNEESANEIIRQFSQRTSME